MAITKEGKIALFNQAIEVTKAAATCSGVCTSHLDLVLEKVYKKMVEISEDILKD